MVLRLLDAAQYSMLEQCGASSLITTEQAPKRAASSAKVANGRAVQKRLFVAPPGNERPLGTQEPRLRRSLRGDELLGQVTQSILISVRIALR